MSVISSIYIAIKANVKDLEKNLSGAAGHIKRFNKSVRSIGLQASAIGAAVTAPLGLAVNRFIAVGDAADKMSLRLGVSVESLTALKYAAGLSGTSIEQVELGLTRLARAIESNASIFDRLGVNLAELRRLTPDQQFLQLSEVISKIEDPTLRAAAAQELFGRSGAKLLPLMLEGRDGIQALMDTAKELGLTLTTDAAKAAAKLGDDIDTLKQRAYALYVQIGAALAPAVLQLVEQVSRVLPPLVAWVQQNGTLITIIGVLGAALTAIGATLGSMSLIVTGISTAVGFLGTVFGALAAAIALVFTPLGAIVAALTAFFAFTEEGQAFVSWLYDELVAAFWEVARTGTDLWELMQPYLMATWDLFKQFATWLWDNFGFVFEAIGNLVGLQFKAMALIAKTLWDLLTGFVGWLRDNFGGAFEFVGQVAMGVFNAIKETIEFIAGSLKSLLQTLGLVSEKTASVADVAAPIANEQSNVEQKQEVVAKAEGVADKQKAAATIVDFAKQFASTAQSALIQGNTRRGLRRFGEQLDRNREIKDRVELGKNPAFLAGLVGAVKSGLPKIKEKEKKTSGARASTLAQTVELGSAEATRLLAERNAEQNGTKKFQDESINLQRKQVRELQRANSDRASFNILQAKLIGG